MKFFMLTVLLMSLAAMVKAQCNAQCSRVRAPVCAIYLYNDCKVYRTHNNQCSLDYYNCMNPTKDYLTKFHGAWAGQTCAELGYPEAPLD